MSIVLVESRRDIFHTCVSCDFAAMHPFQSILIAVIHCDCLHGTTPSANDAACTDHSNERKYIVRCKEKRSVASNKMRSNDTT